MSGFTLENFVDDLPSAFEYGSVVHGEVTEEELVAARWDHWFYDSPEGYGSTDMHGLGQLRDGRWVALEGWADTTGWGCQCGATIYVAGDREQVVKYGVTQEQAAALGIHDEKP